MQAEHRRRPAHRRAPGRRLLRGRAQRLSLGVALLGLVAALAPVPSTAASANVVDPCSGNHKPSVVSTTVNQGLGTYTPLVRGKSTLVRLFLKAPSCVGSGGSLQLVSTSVQVKEGGVPLETRSTTPDPLGPVYPTIESASSPTSPNGPAHPLVKFPALGKGTSTGATTLTFDATVVYQYVAAAGATPITVEAQFPAVATAAMAPPSAPLRVLAIPMGDASAARGTQFPTLANGGVPVNGQWADTVLQTAMQTVSRTLPVADGVADLTAPGEGGLLYRLALNTMLDLGPQGLGHQPSGGKVCIDGATFTQSVGGKSIASELAAYLAAWNADNPTTKADRVVGLAWQGISGGTGGLPGSTKSCAEGLGTLNGTTAYIRLLAGGVAGLPPTTNPSMSGALALMELAHTAGALASNDPRAEGAHSKNTTADPEGTKRAYDTTLAQWLEQPRSGLRYTGESSGYVSLGGKASPWNDTNVLLEKQDYAFLQCELSISSLSSCPSGATRGGMTVAAAGAGVVISGTTDGTVEGTQLSSRFDATAEPTQPDPLSDYRLVLRDQVGNPVAACATSSLGCTPEGHLRLPVAPIGSSHHHDVSVSTPHVSPAVQSLYAATAVPTSAKRLEVWKGLPTAPCASWDMPAGCLYARESSTDPVIAAGGRATSLAVPDLTRVVSDTGDDLAPALSPQGDVLAWVTAQGIVLQRRNPLTGQLTGARTDAFSGREPAWAPDGNSLAYSTPSGDIERRSVDRSGSAIKVGLFPSIVYNHLLQQVSRSDSSAPPEKSPSEASSPSFSPDGTELAVLINNGIWTLKADLDPTSVFCRLLDLEDTSTCQSVAQAAHDEQFDAPDWGARASDRSASAPDEPESLIAFVRNGDIVTVPPSGEEPPTLRIAAADEPAWGNDLLVYVKKGQKAGMYVADPTVESTEGGYTSVAALTDQPADAAPAVARDASALALQRGALPGSRDIWTGTLADTGVVAFSATTDGDPLLLRAHLSLSCGVGTEPVLVDLRPVLTKGKTAHFRAVYRPENACSGGELSALATNGWNWARQHLRGYPVDPTPPAPSPALAAPRDGARFLQYDAIVGVASSVDPVVGTNAATATLTWTLAGPIVNGEVAATGTVVTATGTVVTLQPPSDGGRLPGAYALTLTASAPDRAPTRQTVNLEVLPDPNHLGVNAVVTFDPQTLYVPSNGNSVTVRVWPQAQKFQNVRSSSVRVTSVGGVPAELSVIRTDGWTRNVDGSWTAKFDRQALSDLVLQTGLVGHYVQIVVQGGSGANAFIGYDPRYPVTSPSA